MFVPVYMRDFKCNSIVIRTGGFVVEMLEALIELYLFFAKHDTGKN